MVNEELMGAGCMARPVSRCRSTGRRQHKKAPGAGPLVHKGHLDRGEDVKSRSCTHNDVFQSCGRFSSAGSLALKEAVGGVPIRRQRDRDQRWSL
jgi:hypothetical protein